MAKTEFVCNHCGYCCTDPSTQINMTLLDIKWLSDFLKMSVGELFEKGIVAFIPFIRTEDFSKFDVEFGMKRPCPLYKDNKCQSYESRPMNCRIFPYWFITHKIIDELDCVKELEPDPLTSFRYRMYERMVGNTLLEEGKKTDEFIKKIGATQSIDLSGDKDVKKLIKLYRRRSEENDKRALKIARKLMDMAEKKVEKERLLKKIPQIEEEINKLNFEEKIEALINAEAILDGTITKVEFGTDFKTLK